MTLRKRIPIPMEDTILHTVDCPICEDLDCICRQLEYEQYLADQQRPPKRSSPLRSEEGTKILHGYVIQVWRADGQPWQHEDRTVYAEKGRLPDAWDQIKKDPSVRRAVIFSTTQSERPSQKRKVVDRFFNPLMEGAS
jgi:hypothetical protein